MNPAAATVDDLIGRSTLELVNMPIKEIMILLKPCFEVQESVFNLERKGNKKVGKVGSRAVDLTTTFNLDQVRKSGKAMRAKMKPGIKVDAKALAGATSAKQKDMLKDIMKQMNDTVAKAKAKDKE